jgi:hypothetical protein
MPATRFGSELDCFVPLAVTTHKIKSPAVSRGAFVLNIVKEDVPSLAGLAATYSSKP